MSKRHTPQENARIVLEFLNTGTSAVELCRKHNVSLDAFRTGRTNSWKAGNRPWRVCPIGLKPKNHVHPANATGFCHTGTLEKTKNTPTVTSWTQNPDESGVG